MRTAKNRCQGRAATDGGMFDSATADLAALDTVTGRAILQRLDANTDSEFPDRDRHIEQIARVVLYRKGHR